MRSVIKEAKQIRLEDIAIGRHGEPLVPNGKTVLTHCADEGEDLVKAESFAWL